MSEPLTKSQQALRGRKLTDMTDEQLHDWMDACVKMEAWPHIASKARRSWKDSGQRAQVELDRRIAKSMS